MNYEFSLTLVNLKIMSLERPVQYGSRRTKRNVKYGPWNMDYSESAKDCIRTALSASPMSISACNLGHFFHHFVWNLEYPTLRPFSNLKFQNCGSRARCWMQPPSSTLGGTSRAVGKRAAPPDPTRLDACSLWPWLWHAVAHSWLTVVVAVPMLFGVAKSSVIVVW